MPTKKNDDVVLRELKILSERAGLRLSGVEIKELEPLYRGFREQLEALHQVDLANHEPAVAFSPDWDTSA